MAYVPKKKPKLNADLGETLSATLPRKQRDVSQEKGNPHRIQKGEVRNPRGGRGPGFNVALTTLSKKMFLDSGMMPLDFFVAVYRDELYSEYARKMCDKGRTVYYERTAKAQKLEVSLNQRLIAAAHAAPYLHKKQPIAIEPVLPGAAAYDERALRALPNESLATLLGILDQVDRNTVIVGESTVVNDTNA